MGDETLVHYFTPESKAQSMHSIPKGGWSHKKANLSVRIHCRNFKSLLTEASDLKFLQCMRDTQIFLFPQVSSHYVAVLPIYRELGFFLERPSYTLSFKD